MHDSITIPTLNLTGINIIDSAVIMTGRNIAATGNTGPIDSTEIPIIREHPDVTTIDTIRVEIPITVVIVTAMDGIIMTYLVP